MGFRRFGCFLFHFREIEACNQLLASLSNGFSQAIIIRAQCERGTLIPSGEFKVNHFFKMATEMNQSSFFGRCAGFQVSVIK